MSRKNNKAKKAGKAAKSAAPKFVKSVHVSASLKLEGDNLPWGALTELFIDKDGSLKGAGRCGDVNHVCTKAEIPLFIEFLKEVHEATAA